MESKERIYKSIVRSILTYAAETRTDTNKIIQMLETTEMKTLRRIAKKTRWDRVKNEKISLNIIFKIIHYIIIYLYINY